VVSVRSTLGGHPKKEEHMAIAVIARIPSKEAYEGINEKMSGSNRPTENPEGNIIHTAGEGPNGFCVVDVWESREAFETFMNDKIMPAMQASGMEGQGVQPEIIELVTVLMNEEARV
jgi:quinol monooxygenase YgiN